MKTYITYIVLFLFFSFNCFSVDVFNSKREYIVSSKDLGKEIEIPVQIKTDSVKTIKVTRKISKFENIKYDVSGAVSNDFINIPLDKKNPKVDIIKVKLPKEMAGTKYFRYYYKDDAVTKSNIGIKYSTLELIGITVADKIKLDILADSFKISDGLLKFNLTNNSNTFIKNLVGYILVFDKNKKVLNKIDVSFGNYSGFLFQEKSKEIVVSDSKINKYHGKNFKLIISMKNGEFLKSFDFSI